MKKVEPGMVVQSIYTDALYRIEKIDGRLVEAVGIEADNMDQRQILQIDSIKDVCKTASCHPVPILLLRTGKKTKKSTKKSRL